MSADLLAAFGFPESSPVSDVGAVIVGKDQTAGHNDNNNNNNNEHRDAVKPQSGDHSRSTLRSQHVTQTVRQNKDKNEPLWKQDGSGTDILFDASDDDGDDSVDQAEEAFGEFETVPADENDKTAPKRQRTTEVSADLLGLGFDEMGPPSLVTSVSQFPQRVERVDGSSSQVEIFNSNKKDRTHFQAVVDSRDDDDWGDFEDVEAEGGIRQAETRVASFRQTPVRAIHVKDGTEDNDDWNFFVDNTSESKEATSQQPIQPSSSVSELKKPSSTRTNTALVTVEQSQTRPDHQSRSKPTNIPPPSSLLQLLPQIYATLAEQGRAESKSPPSPHLAHSILKIYMTSARLIAGRNHRWKRDHHLSQSTRISQAGLKNTGMKLTLLDRSEAIKEDQDTAEVLAAWRRHAPTLNIAMLRAKLQKPHQPLAPTMAVKTEMGPAVLMAKDCCAVCGLKRNERVVGVDVNIEDTFGEFWVEHWGHTDCYKFWYTYEEMLDRR